MLHTLAAMYRDTCITDNSSIVMACHWNKLWVIFLSLYILPSANPPCSLFLSSVQPPAPSVSFESLITFQITSKEPAVFLSCFCVLPLLVSVAYFLDKFPHNIQNCLWFRVPLYYRYCIFAFWAHSRLGKKPYKYRGSWFFFGSSNNFLQLRPWKWVLDVYVWADWGSLCHRGGSSGLPHVLALVLAAGWCTRWAGRAGAGPCGGVVGGQDCHTWP